MNDTRLTVSSLAQLSLASCAHLDLAGPGTTLYVEDAGSVYISGCAQLTAYAGTTISVNNRSDITGGAGPAGLLLKVGSKLVIRSTGQTILGTL